MSIITDILNKKTYFAYKFINAMLVTSKIETIFKKIEKRVDVKIIIKKEIVMLTSIVLRLYCMQEKSVKKLKYVN